MKRTLKLCFMIVISIMFIAVSGCLNPVGIDNYGYVVTIGVDKGQEKEYEVILELQRERSNEGGESEGGAIILSAQGDTLFEVINELSWGTAYQLNFTRTHVFVFSEELAREGKIEEFFSMSFDMLRIRQSAIIMVTHCTVKEFFGGLNANNNANITKIQDDLLNDEKMSGQVIMLDVATFIEACKGGRFDAVLSIGYYDENIVTDAKQKENSAKGDNPVADVKPGEKTGGMQSLTVGAALFDGWKMTGILDGHQTQFLNMGRGTFDTGNIVFTLDGEIPIALLTRLDGYSVELDMMGGKNGDVKATVNITLDVSVEQDSSHTISSNWEDMSKERLTEYFEGQLHDVFETCQKNNCDGMGFGRYVSMKFRDTEQWENYDWKESFKSMEVEFKVELLLDDLYIALTQQ